MVQQIVTSAFRQIWRKPLLPVMNMLGLAGGMAVTILILVYAHTELNYDGWVTDQENLYRVEGEFLGSSSGFMDNSPTPLASTLLREVSEVESAVRVRDQNWPVKYGNFVNYESVASVDVAFLDMFPLEFIRGSKASAFQTINNVVVSESMAKKYFGDADAIGQTLTINGNLEYIISAVFKDQPIYTDYPFHFVAPLQERLIRSSESWSSVSLETFVRLKAGASVADVNEKLAVLVDQHRPFNGGTTDDMREKFRMFVQPFGDLHLGSRGRTAGNAIGNYATIYGFLAIAGLVLVISTFNYVSLAMARALEREKEFCIRKVTGASYGQIVRHVMAESILQTSFAALLGLLIADDTLPYFSSILGADYALADILDATGFLVFIGGTLVLGLLAGLYPAVITSQFRPAKFLSGGKSQRPGVNRLRAALVFIQFTVSIALLIGTVTIARQMDYINELDLGYDPDGLMMIYGVNRPDTIARADTLKSQIKALPGVVSVTRSEVEPNGGSYSFEDFYSASMSPEDAEGMRLIASDYEFFETYKGTLLAGRFLSEERAGDQVHLRDTEEMGDLSEFTTRENNVIINDVAVKEFGYSSPSAIIGERIFMNVETGGTIPVTVVGVVKGLLYQSARSEVNAKVFFHSAPRLRVMTVRLDPAQQQQAMVAIKETWAALYPDTPILQRFMTDRIERLYRNENKQLSLFMLFSVLTVILSLVGLIGLVLNSIGHRTKEISIRRVLGASVADNIKLFTWQYIKPVLIANIPAWAAAYYFLNDWLQKYPQRVDLSPEYYFMGGGVILIITMVLIAVLVVRVASIPPAQALKYE